MEAPPATPSPSVWLIRIPNSFEDLEPDLLRTLGASVTRKLGRDYRLIRPETPDAIGTSELSGYLSWMLPVHHSWPCHPQKTEGFIERAAQALSEKFADQRMQTVMVGALDPGAPNRYYRSLASNLRGRLLQLLPQDCSTIRDAADQAPERLTLFCHVGEEGLFCGLQSPKESGGFFPGGTKFIKQSDGETVSRAGAKIAEALHHLQLHKPTPPSGAHWLELGASPGGMTAELLKRDYRVTAIDRASLDPRVSQNANRLTAITADVATFRPPSGTTYDAMLCDMNGSALDSMRQVVRLSKYLETGASVVFTLKLPGAKSFEEINSLARAVIDTACHGGLKLLAQVHLTYNRHEFTLFLERAPVA